MDNEEDLTKKPSKEIVLLRLYNGEMVIGEHAAAYLSDLGSSADYELDNPRAIAVMPTMGGGIKIAIGSICEPFNVSRLKKRVTISAAQVMFVLTEDDIDKELLNGYKSEISGIRIASAAEAASLNANPSPGEFIL